jgi:hypothetical protein
VFALRNVAGTFNALFTNTNTADRTYTLPDASGTIALTNDVTGITDTAAMSGLRLVWNSATSISVQPGSAYIPGAGKLITVTSDLTLSSIATTSGTWYHVYLFDNAGTAAIEVSATAPAAFYASLARTKTGNTTRRWLGAVYASGTNSIRGFNHDVETGFFMYGGPNAFPPRTLTMYQAAADSTFSNAAGMPPQSFMGFFRLSSNVTAPSNSYVGFAKGGTTDAYTNSTVILGLGINYYGPCPVNASQELTVKFVSGAAATAGGAYCDVYGYYISR